MSPSEPGKTRLLIILDAGYSARLMYNKDKAVDLGYQSVCLPTTPPSKGQGSHLIAHNPAGAYENNVRHMIQRQPLGDVSNNPRYILL